MGSGRPQAAGASSPVILSAAKNPSPIVHPFQRLPRIPRRDGTLPSASPQRPPTPAVGAALTPRGVSRPVCAANNRPQGDPTGYVVLPRSRRRNPAGFALRQIAFVPNAGTLTLAGKSVPYGGRGTRTAGCRPYGERGARSDVGILRDSSSSLPTETACRGGHWPPACGRGSPACHSERSEESVPPRPREKGVRILRFR